MEWLTQLNGAIRYFEEALDGDIDVAKAARMACCSEYQFRRMFSYMTGVPLSEYIRRRRMTRAALDLQRGDRVIDVALRYGYDSPTAFTRAFQGVHGIGPAAAKTEGSGLKAYPPISFTLSIKGEAEMNYRIEKMDAFRVVGVKETFDCSAEIAPKQIPEFWAKVTGSGFIPQICARMDAQPTGLLGLSVGDWPDGGSVDYYIAAASTQAPPEGMVAYEVPAATWAIFECTGPMPAAMQSLQTRVLTEWLPTSGYQYADAPDIEVYSEGDQSSESYKSWVWLPVQKA